jgi:hypothetical protein
LLRGSSVQYLIAVLNKFGSGYVPVRFGKTEEPPQYRVRCVYERLRLALQESENLFIDQDPTRADIASDFRKR